MKTLDQFTNEDLEHLIEQKIIEILGDPDTSLELRDEFRNELRSRLANRLKRVPHEEVLKKLGLR
jgi:hypothetical protein